MKSVVYFRRRLPHFQPENASFFVTFRLIGSLPPDVMLRLKAEQQAAKKQIATLAKQGNEEEYNKALADQQKRYFGKFDEWLDKAVGGERWLSDERIAQLVYDAILYRDGEQYNLICFTIMPNHVHMVFSPLITAQPGKAHNKGKSGKYLLSPIMESLKKYTAGEANNMLGRSGAFWQHESYDRVVRDGNELQGIIKYVLNNPVKAGLTDRPELWKWSYVKERQSVR